MLASSLSQPIMNLKHVPVSILNRPNILVEMLPVSCSHASMLTLRGAICGKVEKHVPAITQLANLNLYKRDNSTS